MLDIIVGHIKCKHCENFTKVTNTDRYLGFCSFLKCLVRSRAKAQLCFRNSNITLTPRQLSYFNRK